MSLLNRRTLMMNNMEDEEDMAEWKEIVNIVTTEEQNALSAVFDKGYNELNILLLIVGTESNDEISNANASYVFDEHSTAGIAGGIALKSGITRAFNMRCESVPYRNAEYKILNQASLAGGRDTEIVRGAYIAVDSNDAFEGFKITLTKGVFGVGSQMIIYGR